MGDQNGEGGSSPRLAWLKVLEAGELGEGRVKPVTCEHTTVCMTRFGGQYAALDNKCPHQGGPLGEGSIENGLLRCPWHGWDFDPVTGRPPGYDDGVRSPGDGSYPEPYWYVSPWPASEQGDLPELKGGGFWHTTGFTAAVLPASRMDGATAAQSREFLLSSVAACHGRLK